MPLKTGLRINQLDLKHLNNKINELSDLGGLGETRKVLEHVGSQSTGRMKQSAPVDTGRLRREVEYTVRVTKAESDLIMESEAIDPETKIDYAPIQEYGLNGVRPTPYFRRWARWGFDELYIRVKTKIAKILNK